MIASSLIETIRSRIADEYELESGGRNRVDVGTPFLFSDGDPYSFSLIRNSDDGRWLITDEGEVISHAGYTGINLKAKGRRARLAKTVEFYGIAEHDGELRLELDAEDNIGQAISRFTQACFEISRLKGLSIASS